MDSVLSFFTGNGLELVAIVVSLVALSRSYSFNRRMIELEGENAKLARLQREIIENERQEKAKVRIGCYAYCAVGDSIRIMIKNAGYVEAYNLRFRFKPLPGTTSPEVNGELVEKFPIVEFLPQDEVNFLIAPDGDTGDVWPAVISWRNRSGVEEEKEVRIQMGRG